MQFSVLIADDNREWCDILKKQMETAGGFRVLPPVYDGEAAISVIESEQPDVVILDLIMPGFDGMYVINYIREKMERYNPFIYVISGAGTQRTNQILRHMEVSYYSVKPIKAMAVAANINRLIAHFDMDGSESGVGGSGDQEMFELMEFSPQFNIDLFIDEYLMEMGASISLISTKCARVAIKKIILDERMITGTMGLYQMVACEFEPNVSVSSVERNIRSALSGIKKRGTPFFQKCFAGMGGNITNANFLYTSAHIIKQRIKQMSGSSMYR